MNYPEALVLLASTSWFGEEPGLQKSRLILAALGDPHKKIPVIQVTGTNGKSSVVWAVSSVLKEHGLKVGTYTSPHLNSYTERFLVNSQPISKRDLCRYLGRVMSAIKECSSHNRAEDYTHFEILTALAYLYFFEQGVDVAVIEVGMGGRWDATSVATPVVSVITNIALDHTDRLGATVKKIAFEKAFVIKRGSVAVVGALSAGPRAVIERRVKAMGAELLVLGAGISAVLKTTGDKKHVRTGPVRAVVVHNKPRFDYIGTRIRIKGLSPGLLGSHQVQNLSLALGASEAFLLRKGLKMSAAGARKGTLHARSPGRLEIVSRIPFIVLDGAHNGAGVENLLDEVKAVFRYNKLICLAAILKDKDLSAILTALVQGSDKLIISKNYFYRAADPEFAAEFVPLKDIKKVHLIKDLKKALVAAKNMTGRGDILLITGSLYTIGNVRYLMGLGPLEK